MKAHTDQEIIRKASVKDKDLQEVKDNRIDVAVDLDDETGTCHTYIVTFEQRAGDWQPVEVNELSSL
ncbi:MAG TPA: hypothetical protein VGE15_09440 [Sphingobacteriaceae bacterium]